jgi:hypothetical protein
VSFFLLQVYRKESVAAGATRTFNTTLNQQDRLVVTVAWFDKGSSSSELQQNLDLTVSGPTDQMWWGNNRTGGDNMTTIERVSH